MKTSFAIEDRASASSLTSFSLYEILLTTVFGVGLIYSAAILILGWRLPLLDLHAFRQTQTALTVQWMALGRPLLAYETPVIGYPWTTPFEYPVFQWTALLLHRLGVDLDNSGRLASWLYFVAGLPLAGYTLRKWGGDRTLVLTFLSLWLFSPLYAYWSRSYMIESCATFFGLVFLASLTAHLNLAVNQAPARLLIASLALTALAAIAAALVKITTFVGFAAAGGGLTTWTMWQAWKSRRTLTALFRIGAGPALAVSASLAATLAWVSFIDKLKGSSPIAALMTSSELRSWNFGSSQIFSTQYWTDVIFGRTASETLGSNFPVLIAVLAAILVPRARIGVFFGIALYVLPFFIFTNLHFLHNYYQYANALFLIFAVAVGVDAIKDIDKAIPGVSPRAGRMAAIALLAVLLVSQLSAYQTRFAPALRMSAMSEKPLQLAAWIKQSVSPEDVVFIIGRDWSPVVPYYAERRAVMFPQWSSEAVVAKSPTDLDLWTGGRSVGAIVDCGAEQDADLERWARPLEAGRVVSIVSGCRAFK